MSYLFYTALVAGFLGQMADAWTTYRILKTGGREIGPMGALMRLVGIWPLFPVKVLLGISPLICQLIYPDYAVWAFAGAIAAAGGWIPAIYNYRGMNRAQLSLF